MPISTKRIREAGAWKGHTWTVQDDAALAKLIAKVALGQHVHVASILISKTSGDANLIPTAISGAKKLLTVPKGQDPWHRDGWMFQVISWIVALEKPTRSIVSPPHAYHAHKGFDGLHLKFNKKGQLKRFYICEDKATTSPRDTIRDKVWPEFQSNKAGERDNQLAAELSTLIGSSGVSDPAAVIQAAVWEESRAFRISITVEDTHKDKNGRKRLFKGYKPAVGGKVSQRVANTFHKADLRKWMSQIADLALLELKRIESELDVVETENV